MAWWVNSQLDGSSAWLQVGWDSSLNERILVATLCFQIVGPGLTSTGGPNWDWTAAESIDIEFKPI